MALRNINLGETLLVFSAIYFVLFGLHEAGVI